MKKVVLSHAVTCLSLSSLLACGVATEEQSSPKIVNGSRVQASANSPERMGTVYLGNCTATAIAKDLVLTAAHCISGTPRVYYKVPGQRAQRVNVASYSVHPQYRFNARPEIDIAMIHLRSSMPNTHRVMPLLFDSSEAARGKEAVQAGYGSTKNGNGQQTDGASGGILRRADTVITSHRVSRIGGSINVRNGSTVRGGTAACSGDSGGPLYVKASDGKWYTAGVTSTAAAGPGSRAGDLDCSGGNTYASIAGNRQWIEETAAELSNRSGANLFDDGGLAFNGSSTPNPQPQPNPQPDPQPQPEFRWLAAANGNITSAPVVGGNEGRDLYVCRIQHQGGVHLGKLIAGDACRIGYGAKEVKSSNYEVLQKSNAFQFISPSNGQIPQNALAGGTEPNGKNSISAMFPMKARFSQVN